jgi:GAF domain-containing protein
VEKFMPLADKNIIQNSDRLAVLYGFQLLDTPQEEAYDRLTRMASKIANAPVSLVALIDADRSFFKSAFGLPEPLATGRQAPLTHSLCQHLVATRQPLIIEDAREHPLVSDDLAVRDFGVVGYLGMPLISSQGAALGSFCVIDMQPRQWTEREIEIVRELAISVMTEIELRGEVMRREGVEKRLRETLSELDGRNRQLERTSEFARSTIEYTMDAVMRGGESAEIMTYLQSAKRGLDLRRGDQGVAFRL